MLLEGLRRNPEALRELPRRDLGLAALAAGVEQIGEESLEQAEALRRDRRARSLRKLLLLARCLGRELRRCCRDVDVSMSGSRDQGGD
jgi:hypothetical protein